MPSLQAPSGIAEVLPTHGHDDHIRIHFSSAFNEPVARGFHSERIIGRPRVVIHQYDNSTHIFILPSDISFSSSHLRRSLSMPAELEKLVYSGI
ncbi:hypothetical protein NLI96_g12266 [Meripilus lineatus]|uniref:Uncharacterized protein n=1 Tax=Meripilus lineatus TaxID=2056292 RepID=A0AAD5UQ73_9APHY|nr:hypothetical protein NLI96_g12266 [Physisporinus lineatus]